MLGASIALGDHLVAHRALAQRCRSRSDVARDRIAGLVDAVRNPGKLTPDDALRVAYRRGLLGIAALDLVAPDPLVAMPVTAAALADLAEAALEAAMVIARDDAGDAAAQCRFAVIAMGKTGGRELNFISDVDVIFVAEPAEVSPRTSRSRWQPASRRGSWPPVAPRPRTDRSGRWMRRCDPRANRASCGRCRATAPTDAGPRHLGVQALLKARVVAGDRDLGATYLEAVQPMVWQAASLENFVDDVQAMRRRVESLIPSAEAERQLKLGPGGLRDIEFSVQLLQLVHGRSDPSVRSGTTLDGLAALAAGGYVGREDAAVLAAAYRLLRTLEHRVQLLRLRRTHLMPTSQSELRRLGRAAATAKTGSRRRSDLEGGGPRSAATHEGSSIGPCSTRWPN